MKLNALKPLLIMCLQQDFARQIFAETVVKTFAPAQTWMQKFWKQSDKKTPALLPASSPCVWDLREYKPSDRPEKVKHIHRETYFDESQSTGCQNWYRQQSKLYIEICLWAESISAQGYELWTLCALSFSAAYSPPNSIWPLLAEKYYKESQQMGKPLTNS